MEPEEGMRCSFYSNGSDCSMTGIGDCVVPLTSCRRDMCSYMKSVGLADVIEESELILNRFGKSDGDSEAMTVCPRHRVALTNRFQKTKQCCYPSHKKRKAGLSAPSCRPISRQMATEVSNMLSQTIPIGGGICTLCRKQLYSLRKSKQLEPTQSHLSEEMSSPPPTQYDPGEGTSSRHPELATSTPWGEAPVEFVLPVTDVAYDSPILPAKRPKLVIPSSSSDTYSSSSESVVEASVWQDRSTLQHENRACLNKILQANDFEPLRSTLNTKWEDISTRQQNYYLSKISDSFLAVLTDIVPGQEAKLWDLMKSRSIGYGQQHQNIKSKQVSISQVEGLISAYLYASLQAQIPILSLFANDFSKDELMKAIPGLTRYKIDKARRHANIIGCGEIQPPKMFKRTRLDPEKTDHFLDFITEPQYLQDVAFGTKTLKLDSGENLVIPGVIRTMMPARLIRKYKELCAEENFDALSDRTLYRIIEVCAASQQTSLQGLDYLASEGADAFETLVTILKEVGNNESVVDDLHAAKRYLKTDYRSHLQQEDQCADHCIGFSLCDEQEDFEQLCGHDHNFQCISCEGLKHCLDEVKSMINDHSTQKASHLHDFDSAKIAINDWKAHLLRGHQQELAKVDFMKTLDQDSVLIIMDWAMKFMPHKFREKQTDFFGKRGKSWHVSCIISKPTQDAQFEVDCLVHIFENVTQNWQAVSAIVDHTLQVVKEKYPTVTSCAIRSDNAGCYHNASLITELPAIGMKNGIHVSRYDFSETQHGKDVCDRKIAPLKRHIKAFVNENNDVETAHEMKIAMESHGGVKGCSVFVCSLIEKRTVSHSIPGISSLHNFCYKTEGTVTSWKAYGTGKGRTIDIGVPSKELVSTLDVLEHPSNPIAGSIPLHTQSRTKSAKIFVCAEDGCADTFFCQQDLDEHVNMGWHERHVDEPADTQYDAIRKDWAARVTGIARKVVSHQKASLVDGISSVEKGWAIKTTKRAERMTADVKAFLTAKFQEGAKSGQKTDGVRCSKLMRVIKNDDGTNRFTPDEWRSSKQINNYFSRLAMEQKRQGLTQEDVVTLDEDEEDSVHLKAIEEEGIRELVYGEVGLSHPFMFENIDLCKLMKTKGLQTLKISELKDICSSFDLTVDTTSKRKLSYTLPLSLVLNECSCKLGE